MVQLKRTLESQSNAAKDTIKAYSKNFSLFISIFFPCLSLCKLTELYLLSRYITNIILNTFVGVSQLLYLMHLEKI